MKNLILSLTISLILLSSYWKWTDEGVVLATFTVVGALSASLLCAILVHQHKKAFNIKK